MSEGNPAAIDLAAFDTRGGANEGRELELKSPDGRATGIRLVLRGADSDAYEAARRAQAAANRAALLKNRQKQFTLEELDEQALELLVAATAGWSAFSWKGEAFAYTAANARKLYREFPHFREQADAFLAERANFLPRSATS